MKRARIGVIGTGWWACYNHIPTILDHPDGDVIAIADLNPNRLKKVGDHFNIGKRYMDYHQMLEKEDLDGAIIATPHTVHAEPAMAAIAKDLHVLVEKPMTTSVKEARAIVGAAEKAGKEVVIPCGWNFRDYTKKAFDLVREIGIGEVQHIMCHMASPLEELLGGTITTYAQDHLVPPVPSTWTDPKKSGGFGWGQMSHSLAWIYRVVDVSPMYGFCLSKNAPTGTDYYDAASIRMTNGATLSLSGSATTPVHCKYQIDIRIFGTEGMLLFDIERERLELRRQNGENDQVIHITPGAGTYDGTFPVRAFTDICAGKGRRSQAEAANGANGVKVVETLDMLYRSMASGKIEEVAP